MKYHWYRVGKRAYHLEAPDWVRSGKALCGRKLKNPGWTISTETPKGPILLHGTFCKDCERRAVK